MQNDNLRGSLGARFEGLSSAPSEGLWDAVAAGLDESKKRRGIIWWWSGAGLAAASLITVLFVVDWSPKTNISKNNGQENRLNHPALKTTESYDLDALADQNTTSNVDALADNQLKESVNDQPKIKDEKSTQFADNKPEDVVNSLVVDTEQKIVKTDDQKRSTVKSWAIASPQLIAVNTENFTLPTVDFEVKNDRFWEVGFGVSSWNGLGLYKKTIDEVVDTVGEATLGFPGVIPVYATSRPVGLAFHLGYHLNNRFRIISGINLESTRTIMKVEKDWSIYPFQSADLVIQSYSQYSVGVPVGISFDFLKIKGLRFGAGFNAINEFTFAERMKVNSDENTVGQDNNTSGFISGYNLGLNPNLNLSYHLSEKLKIQANPGVRWYPVSSSTSIVNLPQRKFYWGGSVRMIWEI